MAAGVPLMKGVFSRQGRLQWREVSDDLQQRLVRRSKPLCLEPEQYFNCLIRKRVYVRDVPSTDGYIPLNEWLLVRFHPVVTRSQPSVTVKLKSRRSWICRLADPGAIFPTGCGSTIDTLSGSTGLAIPASPVADMTSCAAMDSRSCTPLQSPRCLQRLQF
jgi:hypothetical protein